MNTNNKNMSPSSRGKSFTYAANGIFQLFIQEPNAKLHAIATIVAVAAGFVRHLLPWQWVALIFTIGLVWITEALNTCIEHLCDFSCDNKWHPTIKIIKNISAAAVLIAALVSLATGIIIFFL